MQAIVRIRRIDDKTRVALLMCVVAVTLLLVFQSDIDLEAGLLSVLERVNQSGWYGKLIFMFLVVLCVVGLIPSVLLTLGAGLIFGVVVGSLVIVVSETVGALIAFLLGRYMFTELTGRILQKYVRMKALLDYPGVSNWRFVALTRMVPFLPFKIMNYAYGLTPLTVTGYVSGTFLGLWPVTLFNVYIGSLAGDILTLPSAAKPESTFHWMVYSVGLLTTIAFVYFTGRHSIRVLKEIEETQRTSRRSEENV